MPYINLFHNIHLQAILALLLPIAVPLYTTSPFCQIKNQPSRQVPNDLRLFSP
jgi:hypothetical protein